MASPSKEDDVLKLILENSPLREWHFEEIVREAKVTRLVANKWLKKYVKEGILTRVKKKGKFPFLTVGSNNSAYYSLKRVYALDKLHSSGLIPALMSSDDAKTIILFGSIVKGDWYKDSDIDIFVLGKIPDFDKNLYEHKLHKSIELHIFQNKKEVQEVKTGLINNVINGYVVKGRIQDIAEVA
jgi:predicted nucleotidyltransferase